MAILSAILSQFPYQLRRHKMTRIAMAPWETKGFAIYKQFSIKDRVPTVEAIVISLRDDQTYKI